jgi:K+-sensing histidine kinase KdpD
MTTYSMTPQECVEISSECQMFAVPATEIVIPLVHEGRITALLALGRKKSGEAFFSDDLSMLATFAHQSAQMLNQANRYQQARDQVTHLQGQLDGSEESVASMTFQIQRSMSGLHQILEHAVALKTQATENAEARLGTYLTDLAQLEVSARTALQQVTSAQQFTNPVFFDLSTLTTRLMDSFSALAARQGTYLKHEIEPHLLVNGFSKMTEETLIATLDNALKYAADNQEITVTLKRNGARAELCVRSSGREMKVDELPLYFNQIRRMSGFSGGSRAGMKMAMNSDGAVINDEMLSIKTSEEGKVTDVCFTYAVVEA